MDDENPKFRLSLIVAGIIYFLFISWLHNLKWDWMLGKQLPPILAYTIGLSGFVICLGIWLKNLRVVVGSFLIAAAGGLACLFGYWLDQIGASFSNNRKHNDK